MDQTPSLRRALIGLAALIAVIVGGYLWLSDASDDVGDLGSEPPSTQPVITFVRSGGFAGTIDTLTLLDDGTGTVTGDSFKRPEIQVDIGKKQMNDLTAQLDDVWPESSGPINNSGGCADCYQYTVTYRGLEVTISEIVPPRFQSQISRLEQILELPRT